MTSLAGKSQSWADAADEEDATTSSGPKLNKDAELPKELAEKLKLGKKRCWKQQWCPDFIFQKERWWKRARKAPRNQPSLATRKVAVTEVNGRSTVIDAFRAQVSKTLPDGSKEYLQDKTFEQCVKEDGLPEILKDSIDKRFGYQQMTKIQVATIPSILKGHDIFAQAKNGSGKTFAFGLVDFLERVDINLKKSQVIVICYSRELAQQQYNVFQDLTFAANGKCLVLLAFSLLP